MGRLGLVHGSLADGLLVHALLLEELMLQVSHRLLVLDLDEVELLQLGEMRRLAHLRLVAVGCGGERILSLKDRVGHLGRLHLSPVGWRGLVHCDHLLL